MSSSEVPQKFEYPLPTETETKLYPRKGDIDLGTIIIDAGTTPQSLDAQIREVARKAWANHPNNSDHKAGL